MLSLYMKYQSLKNQLLENEEGQGLVEYALIIAIISLVIISAGGPVAVAIGDVFLRIQQALEAYPAGS